MIKFAILCAMATTVRCSAATALASMLDNLETKAQELARKIEEQHSKRCDFEYQVRRRYPITAVRCALRLVH
jgi:hypothetical protein